MKIEFVLDPVIRAVPVNDLDIRTHGCIGVQLMFMLRPSADARQEDLVELTKRMMQAAVGVINEVNLETKNENIIDTDPPV